MNVVRIASLVVIAAAAMLACNEPAAAPPASAQIGAVRVHSALSDAQLFIDAHERGPLRDGMEVELPPGAHVLEARRGGAVVATLTVEVRAALLFEATLSASSAVAAAPNDVAAADEQPSALPLPPSAFPIQAPPPIPAAAPPPARHVESAVERLSPLRTVVNARSAAGSPETPATPARGEILVAMNAIKPAVEACTAGDAHGVFVLRVAFSGDGRVREASAQRSELEPAQERCVLDAVRGLRLPAFSQDQFALTYPFRY